VLAAAPRKNWDALQRFLAAVYAELAAAQWESGRLGMQVDVGFAGAAGRWEGRFRRCDQVVFVDGEWEGVAGCGCGDGGGFGAGKRRGGAERRYGRRARSREEAGYLREPAGARARQPRVGASRKERVSWSADSSACCEGRHGLNKNAKQHCDRVIGD
jgi:hypothetical protein